MTRKLISMLFAAALMAGCGSDDAGSGSNGGGGNNGDGGNSGGGATETETLNQIKKITRTEQLNDNGTPATATWEFAYYTADKDSKQRLARITYTTDGTNSGRSFTATFDYSVSGEVAIKRTEKDGTPDNLTAKLNSYGYATELTDGKSSIYFTYDDNQRLTLITDNTQYGGTTETLKYDSDGLLATLICHEYGQRRGDTTVVSRDSMYAHRYANNTSIDLLPIVSGMDDDYDFLYMAGLLGKRIPCLPEMETSDETANAVYPIPVYFEPNVTVHESQTYYDYPVWKHLGQYTLGAGKRPESFAWSEPFTRTVWEYDVVVGNEPIYEDHPEYKGYKYEIKNEKTTKTNGENKYQLKIEY